MEYVLPALKKATPEYCLSYIKEAPCKIRKYNSDWIIGLFVSRMSFNYHHFIEHILAKYIGKTLKMVDLNHI